MLCGTLSAKADYPKIPFKAGLWTGTLTLNDSVELPFTFDLGFPVLKIVIHNNGEEIEAEDFRFTSDSLFWHMPVFDRVTSVSRASLSREIADCATWHVVPRSGHG